MRIKQHCIPFFLLTLAFLCFIFLAPAFAELEQVEEEELARTNVSISGTPVATEESPDVKKLVENPEALSSADTAVSTDLVLSPKVNTTDPIGLNMHINGQETHMFHFGGSTTNLTGGITTVTPR